MSSNSSKARDSYDIFEHRHRLAVWGAGRANQRQWPGFTMDVATHIIEQSGLMAIKTPDDLPPADEIDQFIDVVIERMATTASAVRYQPKIKNAAGRVVLGEYRPLEFSYGRGQKLVNVYLKTKLVCAGWEGHPSVAALHPPLDGVLLTAIRSYTWRERDKIPAARKAFETAQRLGDTWTTFNKPAYDAHIEAVKLLQGDRPLWAVEWLWQPANAKD